MGLRALLVLLVVLGVVGAALWLTEPAEQDVEGVGQPVLGGHRLVEAERIVVQFDPQLPAVELERGADGAFRLVEPIRDLASAAMLDNLARVYDGAQMLPCYAPDEVTPARLRETEIEPGLGRFEVRWPDGTATELRFGGKGVYGHDMFVLARGAIWTVQAALRSALVANVSDYRERFVFRNTREQIGRLELRRRRVDGSVEVIELRRRGQGFEVAGREHFDLNQGMVADVIDRIVALRVDRFVEGRRRPGPVEPELVVRIDGGMGSEQVDLYLGEGGEMFGWATPRELEFFAEPGQYRVVFELPLADLRSSLLFPYEILDGLEAVTVAPSSGRPLTLERAGRDLRLSAPIASPAHPTPVAELLDALRNLHVVDFVEDDAADLGRYGLARDYLVLRLRGGARRQSYDVHLGARDGEVTYAKRADSPHVVAVASAAADVVRRPWIDYLSLQVLEIPAAGAITVIRAARGGGEAVYRRDDTGAWHADAGGAVADHAEEAFDVARDLVGKQAFERTALEGLGAPLRIAFGSTELGEVHVLEVFEGPSGEILVGREGSEFVFEVARRDGRTFLELAPD